MIPATGALFERMDFIDDPTPRSAAMNMAIDEDLLTRLSALPILRIYRWAQPAVSIGCFEPVSPVRSTYPDRELVRRWTGGGVVEHGADLTYSLLAPRALPLATMRPDESYRLIHAAVVLALARMGIADTTLESIEGQSGSASRSCFEKPVPYDVLAGGHKVAGGAQRRTRCGLLHQGSILFALPAGTTAPDSLLHVKLVRELAGCFGRDLHPRPLLPEEYRAAAALAAAKYGAAPWTQKF